MEYLFVSQSLSAVVSYLLPLLPSWYQTPTISLQMITETLPEEEDNGWYYNLEIILPS